MRRIVVGLTALVAVATGMGLVASPAEAAPLFCRASVSDSTPKQYSNVYVRVKTRPHARVRTVAHYRTTNTAHARKANDDGVARITYYTSGATPGFRVYVNVTVRKNGHLRTCRTSFVPHQ